MDTDQPRHLTWTDREREVLDLLTAGRTNAEIAEKLGISPEAAKRQVNDVIRKAGVFSREDAADYWRSRHRPVRRVLLAVRRLAAMRAWVKLSVAGAVAVVLAVLLVPPFLFDTDDAGPVATEVWFADIEGVPHGSLSTLHLWSPNVAPDHALKFKGGLVSPRWSPDGQRLAIVHVRNLQDVSPTAELVLLKRPSWQQQVVALDGTKWRGLEWSPDGRLLVINTDSFAIFSSDGKLERVIAGVHADAGHHEMPKASWSPNGGYFVALQHAQMIVAGRDGHIYPVPRPGGTEDSDWSFGRWLDDESFVATTQPLFSGGAVPSINLYRVDLKGGQATVSPSPPAADYTSAFRAAFGDTALLPPLANGLGYYRATADGTARVFVAAAASPAATPLARDVAVQLRDGTIVRDRLPLTAPGPDSFDIVVLNP